MLQKQHIDALAENLPFFSKKCLVIRDKEGKLNHLKFNYAQQYLHEQLEQQKRETGAVRAIVLKGRKQGVSTYVGARFYHRCIFNVGQRVMVMAHKGDSSGVLFSMTKLMHEKCPESVRPKVNKDSAKEFSFPALTGSYAVSTAGSGDAGRGDTPQMLHGSEVAFWENTKEISSGALQAVPDVAGTEIILESTPNGMGNMFYDMCMKAQRGEGEYILIFIPWYWDEDYRKTVPEGFEITKEEAEYKKRWNLDDEQIFWRRMKIYALDGGEAEFKKEYPACVSEAFEATSEGALITPAVVMRARKTTITEYYDAPLIVGFDPAGQGKDRIGVAYRTGRVCSKIYRLPKVNDLENVTGIMVDHILRIIKDDKPVMVNIDNGHLGTAVCDILLNNHGDGIAKVIRRVNFGEKEPEGSKYKLRRGYMWGMMKEWLETPPCVIPDDDGLHIDLTNVLAFNTENNMVKLEPKTSERRKKLKLASPDLADALALTFAFPFVVATQMQGGFQQRQQHYGGYQKLF